MRVNAPNLHLGQRKPTDRRAAPASEAMAPPMRTAVFASAGVMSNEPPWR